MHGLARRATIGLLCLALAGCGGLRDSKLNPLNWFGRSQPKAQTLTVDGSSAPVDNRANVTQVTSLEVESIPEGAIVRASGLPPTQGFWDAELVAENDGYPVDGVLTYRFVVAEPPGPRRSGTPQSREVTAADYLSNIDLSEITEIVVLGSENSRSTRR
jgi:hypothetical protein